MKYLSNSDNETIDLGKRLGSVLSGGDVVALTGALGSGKTRLTKGIGLGLGIDPDEVITSPSFSLVNEYKGRFQLYHMDLYRLEGLSDIMMLGLEEYFRDDSVVVIEWAERCPELLPSVCIKIKISILENNSRSIEIKSSDSNVYGIIRNCLNNSI